MFEVFRLALKADASVTFSGVAQMIAVIVAIVAAFRAARRSAGPDRAGWRLIGWATVCWASALVLWIVHNTGLVAMGTSLHPHDVLFFSAYGLGMVGLFRLTARVTNGWTTFGLDWLIALGSLLAVAWLHVLGPTIQTFHGTHGQRLVALAYPIADVCLLSLVFATLSRARFGALRVFGCIGVGLGLLATGDVTSLTLNMHGITPTGRYTDVIFFTAALSIAVATRLAPRLAEGATLEERDPGLLRTMLPFAGFLVASATFAQSDGSRIPNRTVLPITAFVVAAAFVVRLFLLIVENRRLVNDLRADVERRAEAEAATRDALERERQAAASLRELHDAKVAFMTGVSHDMRTPLTSVVGFARTLETRGETMPLEDRTEVTQRLTAAAMRLNRLLGDVLDLDRLGRGVIVARREETDLGSLVAGVVEEMRSFPGHDIAFVSPSEPLTASVDRGMVERIVQNLVSNAVRHTPAGTRIRVALALDGPAVVLSVDDSGPGIPPESAQQIFEPFTRGTKNHPSPGTGIGLALVAQFAALHEGSARVETSELGGARFVVRFPRESAATGAA